MDLKKNGGGCTSSREQLLHGAISCLLQLNRYRTQSDLMRFVLDKIRMTGKSSFEREGIVFTPGSESFSSPLAARLFDALFQRTLI